MFIEVSPFWIVVLNLCCIPVIQVGLSWLFLRLPRSWFAADRFLFRERWWERGGWLYERFFAVRLWKGLLPDGAPWLGGFAKAGLKSRDPAYLSEFCAESCRGEAAHLAQIPGVLLTLAWNPWPVAALVIAAYALLSNLPCIVVQRYTRLRLNRLISRAGSH